MFAKLFGTDDDQVVALLQSGDDGEPEIRVLAQPKGLGVCFIGVSYEDTDAGWTRAETQFKELDEASVRLLAEPLYNAAQQMA